MRTLEFEILRFRKQERERQRREQESKKLIKGGRKKRLKRIKEKASVNKALDDKNEREKDKEEPRN